MEVSDARRKFAREIIEDNLCKCKVINRRRCGYTRGSKEEKAKNKSWKNFQKFKEETKNGLDCENAAGVVNLKFICQ